MKKSKTTIATLLLICFSVFVAQTISAKAAGITPYYNNTQTAVMYMSIDDNGLMTITYRYSGLPSSTTGATITTYIEKKTLGLFWTRVDIGTSDNQWVDTVSSYTYTGSRTHQLSASGTYRTTVTYEVYGTNGPADTITCEDTATY